MSHAKSPAVRIVVDIHERQSGIAETLRQLGAEVEIAALRAGDYAVGADTLVERKRVLDLHAAALKGRLWPQLGKLRAACAFPYLLVEGTDIDRGPLHHNAVRGACLAVIDQGNALLRSGYQRDSALWIHRLAVRCQQVEPGGPARVCPATSTETGGRDSRGALGRRPRNLDHLSPSVAQPIRQRGRGGGRRSSRVAERPGHRTRTRPRPSRDVHARSETA